MPYFRELQVAPESAAASQSITEEPSANLPIEAAQLPLTEYDSYGKWAVRLGEEAQMVKAKIVATVLCGALLAVTAPTPCCRAETLVLRNGVTISGQILKSTAANFYVDLGYDVIAVPAGHVLETRSNDGDVPVPTEAGTGIYNIGSLETTSIAEASTRFAPTVVLVRTPSGLGSGFFVSGDGYLLTNFHVIRGEKHIAVTRFAREESVLRRIIYRDVRIVATDPFHDLAVLKVDDEDLSSQLESVVFSVSEKVVTGETVFVIGNPLGLERTVTRGVISQSARNFAGKLYLQIDASVNAGNSGGPLFNEAGEVIGVVNMKVPQMEGLNFAIPIRHGMFLLDHLDDYAYDATNSESGYYYPDPPRRSGKNAGTTDTSKAR